MCLKSNETGRSIRDLYLRCQCQLSRTLLTVVWYKFLFNGVTKMEKHNF